MAYSKKAKDLRRCTYHYPDDHECAGERCKSYAMWDSDWRGGNGLCYAHTVKGESTGPHSYWHCKQTYTRTVAVCECEAYQWPHRPGGGLCRWPDPPLYKSTIEEGTHASRLWRRPEGLPSLGPTPTNRRTFHVELLPKSEHG